MLTLSNLHLFVIAFAHVLFTTRHPEAVVTLSELFVPTRTVKSAVEPLLVGTNNLRKN